MDLDSGRWTMMLFHAPIRLIIKTPPLSSAAVYYLLLLALLAVVNGNNDAPRIRSRSIDRSIGGARASASCGRKEIS